MSLPAAFLDRPITHRGLHDRSQGRTENSIASFEAAITHGYGIELDLQLSKDGRAMAFHDYDLGRLTEESGPVAQRMANDLRQIALKDDGGTIPTFAEVLSLVAGRVPLLVELKDQDGAMGPSIGALEEAVAGDLATYSGAVALMSFNPHSVAALARLVPDIPRGLVTSAYTAEDWPTVPRAVRDILREIPDFDRVGATFISHEAADLGRDRVAELKRGGAAILCWTIRSEEQEARARQIADNVTFEGYLA